MKKFIISVLTILTLMIPAVVYSQDSDSTITRRGQFINGSVLTAFGHLSFSVIIRDSTKDRSATFILKDSSTLDKIGVKKRTYPSDCCCILNSIQSWFPLLTWEMHTDVSMEGHYMEGIFYITSFTSDIFEIRFEKTAEGNKLIYNEF